MTADRPTVAEKWVSINEACILVGRSRRTIYTWLDEGLVRFQTLPRRQLNVEDVLRVESQKRPGRPRKEPP